MKKRVLFIILIIILLLIGIGIAWLVTKDNENEEDLMEGNSTKRDVHILSKLFPTKILIYGDKIDFEENYEVSIMDEKLDVEYISEISEETIEFPDGCKYVAIIINDIAKSAFMTDEQWMLIENKIQKDRRYHWFYIGDDDVEQLISLDIIDDSAYMPGDMAVGKQYEGDTLITASGVYTDNQYDDLVESILRNISYGIRRTHGID